MSAGDRQYIGDGVYVEFLAGMIRLSTDNGDETTNVIYLEEEVWRALKAWVEHLENHLEKQAKEK